MNMNKKFNIKEWKDTQLKGDKTLMESPVKNIAKAIPQNYPSKLSLKIIPTTS